VPPNIALEPSAPLKDERRGSARALGGATPTDPLDGMNQPPGHTKLD